MSPKELRYNLKLDFRVVKMKKEQAPQQGGIGC